MAAARLLRSLAAAIAARQAAALVPFASWAGLGLGFDSTGLAPAGPAAATFEPLSISVPVDHFHNESKYEPHSNASFQLRYWFDAAHYEEGGPVIVLHSGESPGDDRLPYLEYGILSILARATHGIGVVLEHRYYGASIPMPGSTAADLRFLSTEQTLADNAYFARNVHFAAPGHANVTSSTAPFIIYGGSYAGAVAALTRKLYPDAYWGAISSSGVPAAIDDYWQYLEAARHYAPGECSPTIQKLTDVIDNMLLGGDRAKADEIKHLFGLKALPDDDFASVISRGIMGLQSTSWDPDEDSADYGLFCAAISSDESLFASTAHLTTAVRRAVVAAGYDAEEDELTPRMLNYIGYVKQQTRQDKARHCQTSSLRQCYSMRLGSNSTVQTASSMRSWAYQTCTQWGFYITGSGVPKDRLPLVSRAITLDYASDLCRAYFNITTRPDVDSINKLGGFNLSYSRLAFIDGAQDPWRQASPHAIGLEPRPSTTSEPFILIDPGVHHWDESGVQNEAQRQVGLPPKQVVEVQQQEVDFVRAWLKEWHRHQKHRKGDGGAVQEL